MSAHDDEHAPVKTVLWARLLLLLPFIGVLWVPFYNAADPMIAGVPFFYWYQLAWIPLSSVIIAIVYFVER